MEPQENTKPIARKLKHFPATSLTIEELFELFREKVSHIYRLYQIIR